MHFRQILHSDLGCASYLIADRGEAAVIDPKWEIDEYLEAAAEAGAVIQHVIETHHHSDHISGRTRLMRACGAAAHLPGRGNGRGIRGGEIVRVGDLELVALATPGHRHEHISYLVHDAGVASLLLSGDSLLVDDVARPDVGVAPDEGARAMWQSLKRIMALADGVELWPGHVDWTGKSAGGCAATSCTIGQARRYNPLLRLADSAAFVAELTRLAAPAHPNLARVLELNLRGVAYPGPVRELDAHGLALFFDAGLCLIDVRDSEAFNTCHLRGSINLPASGLRLGTRAASATSGDQPIVLVTPSYEAGRAAAELLRAAGVPNLAGMTVADPQEWEAAGLAPATKRPGPAPRPAPPQSPPSTPPAPARSHAA